MRAVLQRVTHASVVANGVPTGAIGPGLMILLGVEVADGPEVSMADVLWLAQKVAQMRIFSDEEGLMNRSVQDIDGNILVVSQFTLFADTSSRRPGFTGAAKPDIAIPLYQRFMEQCRQKGFHVEHGEFGADMQVFSQNDGPVTILLDVE